MFSPEREEQCLRFAVAGVVSSDLPVVFPNDQTGHFTVGDSRDLGVVGHGHVPLVEALVVPDDGVLGPDVANQSGDLLVHDHVGRVKPSPVTESSQLKFNVLGDEVGDGAGTAGGAIPAIYALCDVTVLVDPALVRGVFCSEQHFSIQLDFLLSQGRGDDEIEMS